MAAEGKTLKVSCPGCARQAEYSPDNPWRPFCSARCKNIDLGAWASEQYRIAGAPADPIEMGDTGGPADPSRSGTH